MQAVPGCRAHVSPRIPKAPSRDHPRNRVAWSSKKGKGMNDIVNTLRQRHHNVTGGNPLIKPLVGPTMFSEAANEIENLRKERNAARGLRDELRAMVTKLIAERDEARREVCVWQGLDTGSTPLDTATVRGWDCFNEDGK